MTDYKIQVNERYAIGPLQNVYTHKTVTAFSQPGEEDGVPPFFACLDCGFVAHDIRQFFHAECSTDLNPANPTWRRYIDEHGFPKRP